MPRFSMLFFAFVLSATAASGQFLSYSKQPQQSQLFQRNPATNRATVQLVGTAPSWSGFSKLELRVSNEAGPLQTIPANLTFSGGTAPFSFSVEMQAIKSNHTFQIFGFNPLNSQWSADKKFEKLLAGDIFIINGQSNAVALSSPDLIDIDEYTRGWLEQYGWGPLNLSYPGRWGARIAVRIADDLGIPAAIFNGANGALKVSDLLPRPGDATANYSQLLKTMDDAGTGRRARAAFFFQGEADGWETSIADYKSQFLALKNAWKSDYAIEKAYLFQMRYQSCTSTQPFVMEAQRQAAEENADVSIMATTNAEHDFCHFYENNAYRVLADRMFELVGNELFSRSFSDATPPDVDSVFSINSTTLEVKLKNPSAAMQIIGQPWADWRVEGPSPVAIASGSISNGRIRLLLASALPATATGLSYLSHAGPAAHFLANQKGVGLLTFFNKKINPATVMPPPPPPPLSGTTDLELTATTATPTPAIYSNAAVVFTLKNNSTTAATGIRVNILTTGQIVYEGGNEFTASAGSFNYSSGDWSIASLAAGATATLTVRFFTLTAAVTSIFGQVMAHSPADSDSQAGNGSTTAATFQDDEAIIRFNSATIPPPPPPPPPPPTGQVNCAAKSLFPWEDWVAEVRIGQNFTKTSSKTPFSDFTSQPISLVRGQAATVALTAGFSYFTFDENWRIWVDLNGNSIFEASEKMFEGIATRPADGTATKTLIGSMTIPTTTAAGRVKMRVVMRRGAFGEACGDVPFGEVEDYTIDILPTLGAGANDRDEAETEAFSAENFALFPNPAENRVELDLKKWADQTVEIRAFDRLGREVFYRKVGSASAFENEKIAVEGWPNGCYFLRIESEGKRPVLKKLIVAATF